MKKNGLIVTKDQDVYLWVIDFIKNASEIKIWTSALVFSALSLAISFYFGESNFFSASGGVITILGLIIFVGISTPVSVDEINLVTQSQISGTPKTTEDNSAEVIQYVVDVVNKTIHARSRQLLGLKVTIYGTLVWAYGWCIEIVYCFPIL